MSEHGAILQTNILELVKCKHRIEFSVQKSLIMFGVPPIDIENFKAQRMQLMETLKAEETEKLRVSPSVEHILHTSNHKI